MHILCENQNKGVYKKIIEIASASNFNEFSTSIYWKSSNKKLTTLNQNELLKHPVPISSYDNILEFTRSPQDQLYSVFDYMEH